MGSSTVSYLGKIFAWGKIDRGIGGMQKWTSRARLTSTLSEEFTGDMFGIYNVDIGQLNDGQVVEGGILLLFGGLLAAAISKTGMLRCPFWWRGCLGGPGPGPDPGPGPEGTLIAG